MGSVIRQRHVSPSGPHRGDMLRILHVNTADVRGGAESVAFDLFRTQRALGHRSWLAVGDKQSGDPDILGIPSRESSRYWPRFWRWLGDRVPLAEQVRGLRSLRRLLRAVGNRSLLRTVRDQLGFEDFDYPGSRRLLALCREPPDIVHCHNLHGGYFDLRYLADLSHRVPVVLTLHDTWLFTGHCAGFLDCQRWRTGCGGCPHLDTYPAVRRDRTAHNWRQKRDIYQRSRLYLTAPSAWLLEKAHRSMLRCIRSRVIPNGIDLDIFQPGSRAEARAALGLPHRAHIVLLIAHNEFKDYATMEKALGQLSPAGDHELVFVCLGMNASDKAVGEGRMIYPGREGNPARMALYYRAADVFIHAATAEAFGKTITEAMACGIPVVATAVGGIPEQITDRLTGFLVPGRDSSAMAATVRRLLADDQLRHAVGCAAAAAARSRFGLDRQVTAFLAWYQEVIDDWHGDTSYSSPLAAARC